MDFRQIGVSNYSLVSMCGARFFELVQGLCMHFEDICDTILILWSLDALNLHLGKYYTTYLKLRLPLTQRFFVRAPMRSKVATTFYSQRRPALPVLVIVPLNLPF